MKKAATAALLALAGLAAVAVPALAIFGDSASIGANTFTTATLEAAGGLSGTAACNGVGVAKVTLSWTATASTFADGYDVLRSATDGGPYTNVGHVNGRNTTSHVDIPLVVNTTYYYVVQATAGGWTSANTNQASATTPPICV